MTHPVERVLNLGRTHWSRRRFFGVSASFLAGITGACAHRNPSTAAAPVGGDVEDQLKRLEERYHDNIYTRLLGVQPHLPVQDHITAAGGSRMPPEVMKAMLEANEYFVDIHELTRAAGRRLSEVMGTEDALVTCGAFSAMILGAAACLTGTDPEKIPALPHPNWPKREYLTQKAHRFGYDRAYRAAGMTNVEVDTREQFRNAVSEKTAMIGLLARLEYERQDDPEVMKPHEFIEIGRRAGVPVLVDAASELPPARNLTRFSRMGADLVVISGGKGMRGPQSTGILAGRADLIEAARIHAAPNGNLGRGMKVGKEEIIGFIVALNRYVDLDHEAVQEEWNRKARYVAEELQNIEGLEAKYTMNGKGYADVELSWDERVIPLTDEEVGERLKNGKPRLIVYGNKVVTRCIRDDELVAATRRLAQFFREEAGRAT